MFNSIFSCHLFHVVERRRRKKYFKVIDDSWMKRIRAKTLNGNVHTWTKLDEGTCKNAFSPSPLDLLEKMWNVKIMFRCPTAKKKISFLFLSLWFISPSREFLESNRNEVWSNATRDGWSLFFHWTAHELNFKNKTSPEKEFMDKSEEFRGGEWSGTFHNLTNHNSSLKRQNSQNSRR